MNLQKIEDLILHSESAQTDAAGNPISMRSQGHTVEIAYRNGYPIGVRVDDRPELDEADINDNLMQTIEKWKKIIRGQPARSFGDSGHDSGRTGQTSAQRQGLLERATAKLKDMGIFKRPPQMSFGYGSAGQGSSMEN